MTHVDHIDDALTRGTVFVVDDDVMIRECIDMMLTEHGMTVRCFADGEAFLAIYERGTTGCLLIDAHLPGVHGVTILQRLHEAGQDMPAIMMTGDSTVPMAVDAMKAGAIDFLQKPFGGPYLIKAVRHALSKSMNETDRNAKYVKATASMSDLTVRQHQVMNMVLAGHPSKNIAADLGISQRTVENHRSEIMRRTDCRSLPDLARKAMLASGPQ